MSNRDMVRSNMEYDNKNQPGVDQFMEFTEGDNAPIDPSEDVVSGDYSPSAKFMQRGLNAYSQRSGGALLKEDGVMGPKTMASVQDMLKSLPPEMKRWAVNKLHKEAGKMEGDSYGGGRDSFQESPDDSEINPFG